MTSLPVPDSPWIRRVASVGATRSDELQHVLHGRRLGDQAGEAKALAQLRPEVLVLAAEGPAGQGLVDAAIELVRLLTLLEVVERPEPDRLLGGFPLRVGGEQDHLGGGRMRLGGAEHVETVAVRHAQVGDDEVEDLLRQTLGRRGDAVGFQHAVAALAEQQSQGASRRGLVVDDQQVRHAHTAARGNRSVTRVPRPGSESISIRPPWAATMRSAMVRPSPLPLGLPV